MLPYLRVRRVIPKKSCCQRVWERKLSIFFLTAIVGYLFYLNVKLNVEHRRTMQIQKKLRELELERRGQLLPASGSVENFAGHRSVGGGVANSMRQHEAVGSGYLSSNRANGPIAGVGNGGLSETRSNTATEMAPYSVSTSLASRADVSVGVKVAQRAFPNSTHVDHGIE